MVELTISHSQKKARKALESPNLILPSCSNKGTSEHCNNPYSVTEPLYRPEIDSHPQAICQ